MEQSKSVGNGQVTSEKRFNSYDILNDGTRKWWSFNTGDILIEVTAWAGLTVPLYIWMFSDTNTCKQASKNYCLMFIFSEHASGYFLQMLSDFDHDCKTKKNK